MSRLTYLYAMRQIEETYYHGTSKCALGMALCVILTALTYNILWLVVSSIILLIMALSMRKTRKEIQRYNRELRLLGEGL